MAHAQAIDSRSAGLDSALHLVRFDIEKTMRAGQLPRPETLFIFMDLHAQLKMRDREKAEKHQQFLSSFERSFSQYRERFEGCRVELEPGLQAIIRDRSGKAVYGAFFDQEAAVEAKQGEPVVSAGEVTQAYHNVWKSIDGLDSDWKGGVSLLLSAASSMAVQQLESAEKQLQLGKISDGDFGRAANEALVSLNRAFESISQALVQAGHGENEVLNALLKKYGLKPIEKRLGSPQKTGLLGVIKTVTQASASLPPHGGLAERSEIRRIMQALGYASGGKAPARKEIPVKLPRAAAGVSRELVLRLLKTRAERLFEGKGKIAKACFKSGACNAAMRDRILNARTPEELVSILAELYEIDPDGFEGILGRF